MNVTGFVQGTLRIGYLVLVAALLPCTAGAQDARPLGEGDRIRLQLQPVTSFEWNGSSAELRPDGAVAVREGVLESNGEESVVVRSAAGPRLLLPRRPSALIGTLVALDDATVHIRSDGGELILPRAGVSMIEQSVGKARVSSAPLVRMGAALGLLVGGLVFFDSPEPVLVGLAGAGLGAAAGSVLGRRPVDVWKPAPAPRLGDARLTQRRGVAFSVRF